MKTMYKTIIIFVAGLLLVLSAFAVINGWVPTAAKDRHPPCGQLPTFEEAVEALHTHQNFFTELEALGDDITVEVGKPCTDDENRALIMVSYDTKSERDAIRILLQESEGFGVPVHLVKK